VRSPFDIAVFTVSSIDKPIWAVVVAAKVGADPEGSSVQSLAGITPAELRRLDIELMRIGLGLPVGVGLSDRNSPALRAEYQRVLAVRELKFQSFFEALLTVRQCITLAGTMLADAVGRLSESRGSPMPTEISGSGSDEKQPNDG
jgi:hypothetical protein